MRCGSHTPISLITTELKFFAKVLVGRLEPCVGKLIHCDQTGFLKGRPYPTPFPYITCIRIGYTPCSNIVPGCAKGLDRVSWIHLWQVLENFGFGKKCISMIKTRYTNPCAIVQRNNILSKTLPLQRGTRQGCPLSPLLFAFT